MPIAHLVVVSVLSLVAGLSSEVQQMLIPTGLWPFMVFKWETLQVQPLLSTIHLPARELKSQHRI